MNKTETMNTVKEILAKKGGYNKEVFDEDKNIFIKSSKTFFNIVSFGKNAVFILDKSIYNWAIKQFVNIEAKRVMDGENLHIIESKLREYNKKLAGEHLRYLFANNEETNVFKPTGFKYKLFKKEDMKNLYENKGFENALNYKNDVIALGAFIENKLVALAGADDYYDDLWQIGIDTLPSYRKQGVATYLVRSLAKEIHSLGKIPYYTTWSANIPSMKIALKTGFTPTWIEYFAVDTDKR
ncbi:GNAT family N-acetyltransferase [Clostridiaceae bacterium M8S5]|nr:GNAT family N-acetyltransferase [Clostridiaceae bacterium M8S5]